MILLDTNIFIEIYRGNSIVHAAVKNMNRHTIAISDVCRAELFYGAKNKQELHDISKDIDGLIVLPILSQISERAVKLVKDYCLSHKLELADALIAATAIYHNIELYTLNIKDFIFIPALKLYNSTNLIP
jgi:predicted nucleic acid-binding protein